VASDTASVVFLVQNLGEQALVFRVQVLNHDEGHAGCGDGAEKLN